MRRRSLVAVSGVLAALVFGCAATPEQATGGVGGAADAGGGRDAFVPEIDPNGMMNAEDLRGECGRFSQTATNTRQPADVIWAVDNGGNMQSDIDFVRDNLKSFADRITSSGVDVRTILITDSLDPDVVSMATPLGGPAGDWRSICIGAPMGSGNCPDDSNPPSFLHVDKEVGRGHSFLPTPEKHPLNMFIQEYPQYRDVLRVGATKTFVVISDVNAATPPNDSAAAFTQNVVALDPTMFASWKLSAVVAFMPPCPGVDVTGLLFPSERGQTYIDLAMQTGGVTGDLCAQDFQGVFDDIANGVIGASQLECEWAIPAAPMGQTFDENKVNVLLTTAGTEQSIGRVDDVSACGTVPHGWYYDSATPPTRLFACDQTCAAIRAATDAKLDVLFGCQTIFAIPD